MLPNNYARSLVGLERFEEAKLLLRKMIPVAQRVLGANHDCTLRLRSCYAKALYHDPAATLDDLREAATTLEDTERTARRVLGGAHPVVAAFENSLRGSQAALERALAKAEIAANEAKIAANEANISTCERALHVLDALSPRESGFGEAVAEAPF